MKTSTAFGLALLAIVTTETSWANGDRIRSKAPMTALVLDARSGNEKPLLDAYFNKQIDFFLDIETPNSKVTRDLYYLREVGRLIEARNFAEADQRLRSLNRFENEKTFLKAVSDSNQNRLEQGLDGFRRLIDKRDELSPSLATLSFLGAARVFHEIGDYQQAIYHYTQVRSDQSQFFQAVFEKSWSFFQNGDMNGALGATLTFLSPSFETAFYPEAWIVRSAAFFQLCYFERASLSIQTFKKEFSPVLEQMTDLQKRPAQSWIFDDESLKKINPRIVASLIQDPIYRSLTRALLGLQNEAKVLSGADSLVTRAAIERVKNLMAQRAEIVMQKNQRMLTDLLAQADVIELEVLQNAANQLLGVTSESMLPTKLINLNDVDFDRRVQFWNFKGEFWNDELGSYYYGLKSNCLE